MRFHSKMLLLCVLSVFVSGAHSECSQPSFKADATTMVEAGFKTIMRRSKLNYDYRTIDIVYSPFLMVEDPNCIEESQLNLEVKSGSGDWIAASGRPDVLGGGKYKWTIDAVPCKDHLIKFWVNGPGGQAALEYPEPIRAATDEQLIADRFTPEKPTSVKVTDLGSNTVTVIWTPADCATAYDISYGSVISSDRKSQIVPASQGSQIIIAEGLKPCTEYIINIFAVVGEDGYSPDEASINFMTPPEPSSANSLQPEVTSALNAVTALWRAYDTLSCVEKYSVSVCREKEDCLESKEVSRNDALDYLKYETDNLEHCSPYTLQIKPLYMEKDMAPKIIDFRTKSPTAAGISQSLMPVLATTGDGQKIYVTWSPVQCADYYEVFQKVNSGGGDWEVVKKTAESKITLNGVPCTEYRYGVMVTIDGMKSEIVEVPEPVITQLDDAEPFVAPNLEIDPLEDGAVLTWDHGACISGYVVKACTVDGDKLCEEETIYRDSTVHNITHEISGLHACSPYTLEIMPIVTGAEFDPDTTEFRTAFPAAAPPPTFSAAFKKGSNKVELEWSEVECASGYKILQMIGNSEETKTAWETDDPSQLFRTLESPEPCVAYSYGVAAVVGGEVSEPTPWQEFRVPPRQGMEHQPTLQIVEKKNDTVNFKISPALTNAKCKVEVYEVRFSSLLKSEKEELSLGPDSLVDGAIPLPLPGASTSGIDLEGRIKYDGFETWSPWISLSDPLIISQGATDEGSMLVPIIIGILVAIVVIVIVVFFVVKKKRGQNKYDAEKAVASKDETAKLNDHPDA